MSFLLDTNVVSETRRAKPHGAVLEWLRRTARHERAISAVTLGELQRGAELRRLQDESEAERLTRFADRVSASYLMLDMDGRCFRQWARLMIGKSKVLTNDAMIAATAMVHGRTVVTRNVRDFQVLGLTVIDPFVDVR